MLDTAARPAPSPADLADTDLDGLRARTRALCAQFPDEYWRETDRDRRYPQEFVDTLTAAGLLAVLIPTEYGGAGLGVTEASVVMEEINRSGGHSAACHAQMYTMGALLRHGSDALKDAYLPLIAKGELRLQAFSITEPAAGSDTTSILTTATWDGDHFVITGHKNWTSRIQESDLALVLARTSHKADNRTQGLTLFLVDLRQVRAEQPDSLEVVPVRTMFNYATNQVDYHGLRVPADHVIGEVDAGFRYVLDGWNAERILLARQRPRRPAAGRERRRRQPGRRRAGHPVPTRDHRGRRRGRAARRPPLRAHRRRPGAARRGRRPAAGGDALFRCRGRAGHPGYQARPLPWPAGGARTRRRGAAGLPGLARAHRRRPGRRRRKVPVPVSAETGFLATAADLEAARTPRTRAVVLASPANPSGAVYTADQLTDIADWALAHDVWVVSDDVYDQFVYDGESAPHLLTLVPELRDRCLVVSGVSKAYAMTGWRVGWLAGPPAVVAAARRHVARTITHVPNVTQAAALAALTGDQQPVHETFARYRRNRDVLATALDGIPGVRCPAPAGGMFVFPDVTALLERGPWATTVELATWLLEDAGVAVVPGAAFDASGHLRLCFAVSPATLDTATARLVEHLSRAGSRG